MDKLTKVQKELYNELLNKIELAKSSKDLKQYVINLQMEGINTDRKDYKSVLEHIENRYDKNVNEMERIYTKHYNDARNNIILTHANSNTLRALENKGYIKIINDAANCKSGFGIDKVKVL